MLIVMYLPGIILYWLAKSRPFTQLLLFQSWILLLFVLMLAFLGYYLKPHESYWALIILCFYFSMFLIFQHKYDLKDRKNGAKQFIDTISVLFLVLHALILLTGLIVMFEGN